MFRCVFGTVLFISSVGSPLLVFNKDIYFLPLPLRPHHLISWDLYFLGIPWDFPPSFYFCFCCSLLEISRSFPAVTVATVVTFHGFWRGKRLFAQVIISFTMMR